MVSLGILDEFLNDPAVSEVMVNGPFHIYIEKGGKLTLSGKKFSSEKEVNEIIEKILTPLGKTISSDMPYVDARFEDGSRVNIVVPPAALNGPMLTIRKFFKEKLKGENLVEFGSLSNNMLKFLELCIKMRKNIVISGGTGSGKTTLLNVISSFIGQDERILTIEDAAELQLPQEHVGRLEARPKDFEGKGEVSIRQLVINALRMRPDRIVVGECRGGEALDMLQAMNTGHDGSLTTVHSNSPRDALKRLEVMVLMSGFDIPVNAIREQIASALNIIVQISRQADGSRKVTEISQVTGMEGSIITLSPVFKFSQSGIDQKTGKVSGEFKATGNIPTFIEQMKAKGMAADLSIFS